MYLNPKTPHILRQIKPAITIFVLLTIITGIAYPLLVTGLAMIFFPWQANGSLYDLHNHHTGSDLIGQPFTSEKYFWSRLSATSPSYNSSLSSGSNYGPTNPAYLERMTSSVQDMQAKSLNAATLIPVDLITSSASGLDPDISVASAYYQIQRVAKARGIDARELTALVNQHIQGPQYGILGESRVNVLALNQALDSYQESGDHSIISSSEKISDKTPVIFGIRGTDWIQFAIFFILLFALVVPVGRYMVEMYQGKSSGIFRIFRTTETWILAKAGIRPDDEMDYKTFAIALIIFNLLGIIVVFLLQQIQQYLPLNPLNLGPVAPDLSLNTAVSFATNTNWQAYAGETTLSYLTQMLGLTVQNFISAATGMAVLVALIYGFSRREAETIGNFWVLLIRSVWILLPLSIILSLILVSQGTIQNFNAPVEIQLLDPLTDNGSVVASTQVIPQGPAASQIAIKLLGTNGGGYFNANSAHPYENPTPLSDILEIIALLLIPAGLCYTFGSMIGSIKKGIALLIAMVIIFIPLVGLCYSAEQSTNPFFSQLGIDQTASAIQPGGNMEGKEVRFGVLHSALFAVSTTATSCGAVNAMHDSFTPLGGLVPLMMIQFGEIVFGGVGSGLGVMIVYVIIAMFIAGLMVGRTPEYLGKKIEPPEMTLAAVVILIPIVAILVGTAIAVVTTAGTFSILNPGAHGFTEILYAFSSAVGNNGSAFGGLSANTLFYNCALALAMIIGRYPMLILLLALAGSFVQKKTVPPSGGTLQDHRPLFIIWLVFVIVSIGVLSFLPALALGPIAEFLVQGGMMHV
ncbi:potassium-transporting ATPase subunit KdpA [Methanospirillum lacunae]|uniref:Multifunctional fusion protein n=1 Tax=Methanospirillum lacunae TaxID=668570 RepID=A0A2V2N3K2_9EURY|nr:potassium-transporting ATPase subunit KdpA [Methanospirillum lacunae]PWR74359.1 potassium-transporting ATPase subunit C [Methanospirillum lacunae]